MYRSVILNLITLLNWDSSVMDYFRVPDGVSRETCLNYIVVQTADSSLIYTSPESMKFMVKNWVDKRLPIWQELYDTTQYDYNPIHNYDRNEEYEEGTNKDFTNKISDTEKGDFTRNLAESFNRNLSENYDRNLSEITDSTSSNTYRNEEDTDRSVAAFNNGLTDSSVDSVHGNGNNSGTAKVTDAQTGNTNTTQTGTTSSQQTGTTGNSKKFDRSENQKEKIDNTHHMHAYGNIGVTTTQDMIEAQREVVQFDIIDFIKDDFVSNFCVMVY